MKKIDIYYHLIKGKKIKEAVITLSMLTPIADDVIKRQRNSEYTASAYSIREPDGIIHQTLDNLAELQGYDAAEFVLADIPQGVHNGY